MNIFVASASRAVGQPLIAALVRQGHRGTGMARDTAHTQTLAMAAPVRAAPHEPARATPWCLWAWATAITTRDRGEQ